MLLYSQTATIRNAGLGYLDGGNGTLFIKFLVDTTSCIDITAPFISNALPGAMNCNLSMIKDTVLIPLSSIKCIGNGDSLWQNNEDMQISYTVKVKCCDNLTRTIRAGWGCNGAQCQISTPFISNVIINNAIPNLVADMPNPNYDYCFTGDVVKQRIRIRNIGAGPASNVILSLDKYFPGSFDAYTAPDTTLPWIVYDKTGTNPLGNITGLVSGNAVNFF